MKATIHHLALTPLEQKGLDEFKADVKKNGYSYDPFPFGYINWHSADRTVRIIVRYKDWGDGAKLVLRRKTGKYKWVHTRIETPR